MIDDINISEENNEAHEKETGEKRFDIDRVVMTYLGLFILPLTFLFSCWILNLPENPSVKNADSQAVSSGNENKKYELIFNSMDKNYIALNEDILELYIRLSTEGESFKNLLDKGKIFSVENQTDIEIIKENGNNRKVKILEGKYKGASGWVSKDCIVEK